MSADRLRTIAEVRAEHRRYAEHRMSLLNLVDEFIEGRDHLRVELQRVLDEFAAAQSLAGTLAMVAAKRRETDRNVVTLQQEITRLGDRMVRAEAQARAIRGRTTRQLVEFQAKNQPLGSIPTRSRNRRATRLLRLIERTAAGLVGLADAGLLGGRHGVRENLVATVGPVLWMTTRQRVAASIERGFKTSPRPPAKLLKLIVAHDRLRRKRAASTERYLRLTSWLDLAAAGDLEAALLLHPSLVAFEETWAVMVDLDITGSGKVEIESIVDDFYVVAIQLLTIDAVRRIFRRLRRLGDRYLLVDRRAPSRLYKGALGAVLDQRAPKKLPLTLEPGQELEDQIIVRHCANTDEDPNYRGALIEINPRLAKDMGLDPAASTKRVARPQGFRGTVVMKQWEDGLQDVRRRWGNLQRILFLDAEAQKRLRPRPIVHRQTV